MSAVDTSSLTKLAGKFLAASSQAPKQLEIVARQGQTFAKGELTNAIGGKYNIPRDRISSAIQVQAKGRYAIEISAPERPIMVNRGYGATQNKAGLRYAIEKGGAPIVLTNGFISKKQKLAMRRLGKARLPIAPVTGPSVGTILKNDKFTAAPVAKIIDALTESATKKIKSLIDQ